MLHISWGRIINDKLVYTYVVKTPREGEHGSSNLWSITVWMMTILDRPSEFTLSKDELGGDKLKGYKRFTLLRPIASMLADDISRIIFDVNVEE